MWERMYVYVCSIYLGSNCSCKHVFLKNNRHFASFLFNDLFLTDEYPIANTIIVGAYIG